MPGYPDFQAYPQWVGADYFTTQQVTVAAPGGTQASGPCSHFPALLLRWQPTVGYAVVAVKFWLDAALTQNAGSLSWQTSTATAVAVSVPVRGPFFSFTVTGMPAGGVTANVFLAPAAAFPGKISYPVHTAEIHQDNVALVASAVAVYPVAFIQPGLAGVSIQPADAAAALSYLAVKLNADSTLGAGIAALGKPAAASYQQIAVPDDAWGVQVTNTDAAGPHTFSLDIVTALGQ